MVNDPIADMLTRIRNAQAVNHKTVVIPFSKLKLNLAEILIKEGLIKKVTPQGRKTRKVIEIELKYQKGQPIINVLRRISKPGRRLYIKKSQIRSIRQGFGLSIISTHQGLMTNSEAKKKGLGGEIMCEIW
ncbi:30S ribosomal protein S8 [Patescibacteria group bacterium]|nr:30S ribosomal protein S8 [Patescibacteria group bacterium]MBU1563852.1 30S ribosomal protein S8 [Patescibacteria group bacterium]